MQPIYPTQVKSITTMLVLEPSMLVWGRGCKVEIVFKKLGFVHPFLKPKNQVLQAPNSRLRPHNLHVFCLGHMQKTCNIEVTWLTKESLWKNSRHQFEQSHCPHRLFFTPRHKQCPQTPLYTVYTSYTITI